MSDAKNEKTKETFSKKVKKDVTIKLEESLIKRLESQIKFLQSIDAPEFKSIKTVEELIVFYIEQLTLSETKLKKMNKQFEDVLNIFASKGVNMKNLLDAFSFDGNGWNVNDDLENDENEGESEDGWETVPDEDDDNNK